MFKGEYERSGRFPGEVPGELVRLGVNAILKPNITGTVVHRLRVPNPDGPPGT